MRDHSCLITGSAFRDVRDKIVSHFIGRGVSSFGASDLVRRGKGAFFVAQTLEPGATVKAVAERYGVLANQLSAWRRAAKDGAFVLPSRAEGEAVFAPLVICDPEGPEAKPDSRIAEIVLALRASPCWLRLRVSGS